MKDQTLLNITPAYFKSCFPDITKYVCLSQSMPFQPTRQTMEAIAKAELEPAKSGAPQPFKPAQRGPESRVPRDCNDLLEFRELESPRTSFLLRIGLRAPKFFEFVPAKSGAPSALQASPDEDQSLKFLETITICSSSRNSSRPVPFFYFE